MGRTDGSGEPLDGLRHSNELLSAERFARRLPKRRAHRGVHRGAAGTRPWWRGGCTGGTPLQSGVLRRVGIVAAEAKGAEAVEHGGEALRAQPMAGAAEETDRRQVLGLLPRRESGLVPVSRSGYGVVAVPGEENKNK